MSRPSHWIRSVNSFQSAIPPVRRIQSMPLRQPRQTFSNNDARLWQRLAQAPRIMTHQIISKLQTKKYAIVSANEMRILLQNFSDAELDEQSLNEMKSFCADGGCQEDRDGNVVQPWKRSLLSHYEVESTDIHRSHMFDWPEDMAEKRRAVPRVWEIVDPDTPPPLRVHQQWPPVADQNPWMKAILRMAAHVSKETARTQPTLQHQMGEETSKKTHVEMLAMRVTAEEQAQGDGEPTPEGVHQDDCRLAVTILLGRNNIAPGGATSRVWPLSQQNGPAGAEDVPTAAKAMTEPLEAVFLWDSDVKHDATPFTVADPQQGQASRELLAVLVDPRFNSNDLAKYR